MRKKSIAALLYMVSLLPFWLLYRFSDGLYFLLFYVVGYRKKVVLENLKNAFPKKEESERLKIAKRFYRFLPDLLVEAVKMRTISKKQVMKRIELLNTEEVWQHFEKGKGVIGVTAHYGNWELGIHRLSLMTDFPRLVIYKPLNDPDFNEVYNALRCRFGATMVPMKQILRHIVRLKNQPHISMFVADQTPTYQDSDYFMQFLQQDTLVYTGTERIAKLTKNPIVYCHIGRKAKRGHYFCKFTTLVENPDDYAPHEITEIHNRFTEKMIQEDPGYWLWSHRRWKRKRRS
ncbi:lysophospholipid acyltransferase family protein [Sphingobacterium oryzagri]|uniref:Lysophospholipid acyltransferase family protein n=1 Tax=Sphingobacterium oryzagri TaxID=3025669 RepID=A0ABY7WLI1_9SPHI|nr:lysophospholipid acyltransferase family protein [Sphingobacterium sp. KACC 22765]WDF70462.1 lysophospholipid acyltransferase family protein [Sphingobacterium sp. KACC 22765]